MKVNFRNLQQLILFLPDNLVTTLMSFILPLKSPDSENEGQALHLTLEYCLSLSSVVCHLLCQADTWIPKMFWTQC